MAWREVASADQGYRNTHTDVARYLPFPEQAGYGLAPIEEHLAHGTGDHTPAALAAGAGKEQAGGAFEAPGVRSATGEYITEAQGMRPRVVAAGVDH